MLMTYRNISNAVAKTVGRYTIMRLLHVEGQVGYNLERGELTASGNLGVWFRGMKLSE